MSELADLTAEATGETVGEAKWAALRELERRHPGLDKATVQFEVVAEGERGILGVGTSGCAPLPLEPSSFGGVRELRRSGTGAGVRATRRLVISPCPTVQRFVVTQ